MEFLAVNEPVLRERGKKLPSGNDPETITHILPFFRVAFCAICRICLSGLAVFISIDPIALGKNQEVSAHDGVAV